MKNDSKNIFYVYAYLDPRKPGLYKYGRIEFEYEPFYIGKGSGARDMKFHEHTTRFVRSLIVCLKRKGLQPVVSRVIDSTTEKEAFAKEKFLIKSIGRRDKNEGPLTNMTAGGEGSSGTICSDELREIRSKNMTGEKHHQYWLGKTFSKDHVRKFKESVRKTISAPGYIDPRIGVKLSKERRLKMSKSRTGLKRTLATRMKMSKAQEGRKPSVSCIERGIECRAKHYLVVSPGKDTRIVFNLTKFCKANGLCPSNMLAVASGKCSSSKGWVCSKLVATNLEGLL